MKRLGILGALLALALGPALAMAQTTVQVSVPVDLDPNNATGIRIEGLVSDSAGRLYTSDLDSRRFFRITPSTGAVEVLGTLPRSATGMAFDRDGNLYLASGDVILRVPATQLSGTSIDSTAVMTFATGLTGANGLAFSSAGNLYVSGGNTGNIYVVASDGMTRTFATGFTSERQEQRISTNGLAFGSDGLLYSSNTGTGAIDRIPVNADGTAGTVERLVTDPLLFGADGITFAANGDLYVAANERNAIVRVTPDRRVEEVASNGNEGPLEFPASPSFSGNALYASNFDIERGANAPNGPGRGASIARIDVGVAGAPLPVGSGAPVTQPTGIVETPTPAATVVPATPPPAPTTAVEPTPTTAAPVPLPPAPLPTDTVVPIAPGMPSTGDPQVWPALMLLAGLLAMAAGLALHRSRRTSHR